MQLTDHLFLVRPAVFHSNAQTAVNNFFQNPTSPSGQDILTEALAEFDNLIAGLEKHGIGVIVFNDEPEPPKPDAVFPNNWVSFHAEGVAVIYPMFAPNRRQERNFSAFGLIEKAGFKIPSKATFTEAELHGEFLEGTGSLVLDRVNRIAYASLSERTNPDLVQEWCEVMDYTPVIFNAVQRVGTELKPVYHTNVVLSVGETHAVLCSDAIPDIDERNEVESSLLQSGKRIVFISNEQMENFCANILQVKNKNGQRFWLMSDRAFAAFTKEQLDVLRTGGKILHFPVPGIEQIGGGSVRCMMAEIFLPLNK